MIDPRKLSATAVLPLGSLLAMAGSSDAFDLNGAWATSADQCDKVFTREGGKLGFTEMSDVYGGGSSVNLIAACATDIMLSSVQFSVKALDADSIVRLFPGMDSLEIRYHRCPLQ